MNPTRLLTRYGDLARPVIRRYFREDSCVASTRITLEVLKRFGLRGEPVPCRCRIWNSSWGVDIDGPETVPERDRLGHLVAWVGRRWLVDASLSQAARPGKGLPAPAVFWCDAQELLTKGGIEGDLVFPEATSRIRYDVHRTWRGFERSPDWLEMARWAAAVERLSAELRKEAA